MKGFEIPHSLTRRSLLSAAAAGAAAMAIPGYRRGAAWGDDSAPVLPGKELQVHTSNPPNAEPELEHLVRSWITPIPWFYVRSHAPSPQIDIGSYRLKVEGLIEKPLSLSVEELVSRFAPAGVVATMCCAGNRRNELNAIKPIEGVQWQASALGNAQWNGVRLAEVLKAAGLKPEAKHVWFEGLDPHEKKGKTILFGGSISLERAMEDPTGMGAALLATHMNHQPLPADHGFPLRTVVPGYIGARSVKWLGKIVVSDRPSDNYYLKDAYKLIPAETPEELSKAPPLMELPLQSVIATVRGLQVDDAGNLRLRGYALPPGKPGVTVKSVEVSTDEGKTWQPARFVSPTSSFCWQLWEAVVKPSRDARSLIVRAVDSQGGQQPAMPEWNAKGYMNNAWHRLPLAGR